MRRFPKTTKYLKIHVNGKLPPSLAAIWRTCPRCGTFATEKNFCLCRHLAPGKKACRPHLFWLSWVLAVLLGILFGLVSFAHATVLTFGDPAQSPDVPWTLSALAGQAGRVSGTFTVSRGGLYRVVCSWQLQGTAEPGQALELFLLPARSGDDGDRPVSHHGMNAGLKGTATVSEASYMPTLTLTKDVQIPSRQPFALALWNNTSRALAANPAVHGCVLSRIEEEE